jgi:hypothetical protein
MMDKASAAQRAASGIEILAATSEEVRIGKGERMAVFN